MLVLAKASAANEPTPPTPKTATVLSFSKSSPSCP